MPWENSLSLSTPENELAWADVSNGTLDALPSYEEETETALFIALVTVAILAALLAISAAVRYMWVQRKSKPVYLGMDGSHTATANSGLTTLSLSNHALDTSVVEDGACVTYAPHRTTETDRNRGISIILLHENELIVETQEYMTEIPCEVRDYQDDLKDLINANLDNDCFTTPCVTANTKPDDGVHEELEDKSVSTWPSTTADEAAASSPCTNALASNTPDIQAESDRLENELPTEVSYEIPYPGVGFTQPCTQTDFFSYTNGNQLAHHGGFYGYSVQMLSKDLLPAKMVTKSSPIYEYNKTSTQISSEPSAEEPNETISAPEGDIQSEIESSDKFENIPQTLTRSLSCQYTKNNNPGSNSHPTHCQPSF